MCDISGATPAAYHSCKGVTWHTAHGQFHDNDESTIHHDAQEHKHTQNTPISKPTNAQSADGCARCSVHSFSASARNGAAALIAHNSALIAHMFALILHITYPDCLCPNSAQIHYTAHIHWATSAKRAGISATHCPNRDLGRTSATDRAPISCRYLHTDCALMRKQGQVYQSDVMQSNAGARLRSRAVAGSVCFCAVLCMPSASMLASKFGSPGALIHAFPCPNCHPMPCPDPRSGQSPFL